MARSIFMEVSTALIEGSVASQIQSGELTPKEARAERRQMLRSAKAVDRLGRKLAKKLR